MSDQNKFPPEVFSLFDKYVHGQISRRDFIDRAGALAIAGMSGAALLDALNPKFAEAQQVKPTDERIEAEYITIPAPGYGKMRGYLVKPAKAPAKLPAVLVVHENRGLNPHIEDIARRIALDGFIAFAPDALHPLGGYPGDEDKARELFQQLDQAKTHADFIAAANYLRTAPGASGKVGVVGFCYGGGVAGFLATKIGRAVLWQSARGRGRGEHQGADAVPVRGDGRAHQRRLASRRRGAEEGERELSGLHLSRHAARVQQRHDAALQQGGGGARVEADDRVLRETPQDVKPGCAGGAGDACS
jgi:dienelactone hydrolase